VLEGESHKEIRFSNVEGSPLPICGAVSVQNQEAFETGSAVAVGMRVEAFRET